MITPGSLGFAGMGVGSLSSNSITSSRGSALYMSSTETKKEIKVGVIGCGRIGLVHLGAITKVGFICVGVYGWTVFLNWF